MKIVNDYVLNNNVIVSNFVFKLYIATRKTTMFLRR